MRILFFLLTLTAFLWSDIGNIGAFKGTATVTRNSETLAIESGMALNVNDKVITATKSRVQVILKDNTVVTIGPETTFIFDAYKFAGKDDSEVKMHIDRGFFRAVTGKIGKLAPERFKVKTVSATIGIRGTDFSALVSEKNEIISCYKGSISILYDNSNFMIDAGSALDVSNGKAEIKLFSKNKGLQTVYTIEKMLEMKADEKADITQQEVQNLVGELEVPLEEPTVEFPNR
ncbi:MAG: FecR domain-containing protein [Bacteroidales bacterium]|nr:FecR domain-containing protein [Bacteroidales bacterium]